MGSLALTASKSIQKQGFFPMMPGVHHVPYAYCYRCAYGKTPDTCAVECVQVIESELFRTILPASDCAAIFVEPVQGEGGYVVPPKKFFDELRRVADKHGILLIFDEVQSGMGRTGKMFACEHFEAVPDVIALAKGIASGLPLAATIARAELMNWPPGAHASTFGGNPVAGRGVAGDHRTSGAGIDRQRGDSRRASRWRACAICPSARATLATCVDWA